MVRPSLRNRIEKVALIFRNFMDEQILITHLNISPSIKLKVDQIKPHDWDFLSNGWTWRVGMWYISFILSTSLKHKQCCSNSITSPLNYPRERQMVSRSQTQPQQACARVYLVFMRCCRILEDLNSSSSPITLTLTSPSRPSSQVTCLL